MFIDLPFMRKWDWKYKVRVEEYGENTDKIQHN